MPDTARLVKLLDAAESNMFWSRIRNSIPGAKLEMHGISSLALSIASPLESGSAKNLNQSGVHISSRSLRIRNQINRDAQLCADSLLPVPGDEKQPPQKLLIRSRSPRS
jgi:hypothetical protein